MLVKVSHSTKVDTELLPEEYGEACEQEAQME